MPSSDRRESLSEAFNSLEGVISPELIRDLGILSVISFFTFQIPAPTIGNAHHTNQPTAADFRLVCHFSAMSIPALCNAPSPAPASTFAQSPAPCQSNPVGQGAASIAPAPPITFPVVTQALYA